MTKLETILIKVNFKNILAPCQLISTRFIDRNNSNIALFCVSRGFQELQTYINFCLFILKQTVHIYKLLIFRLQSINFGFGGVQIALRRGLFTSSYWSETFTVFIRDVSQLDLSKLSPLCKADLINDISKLQYIHLFINNTSTIPFLNDIRTTSTTLIEVRSPRT